MTRPRSTSTTVTRLLPVSGAGNSLGWPREELLRLSDCGIRHCRIPGRFGERSGQERDRSPGCSLAHLLTRAVALTIACDLDTKSGLPMASPSRPPMQYLQ